MSVKHIPTRHHGFLIAAILGSGFFLSMSTALVTYINSTFIGGFVGARWVGIAFSCSYIAALLVLQNYGRLIGRFGNSYVLYANMVLQILAFFVLAKSQCVWLVLPAFAVFVITASSTIINYDIYLKALAPVHRTGRLRGVFWTVVNLGFFFSPFLTGKLVSIGGLPFVYWVSAFLILPSLLMMYLAYNGNRYRIPFRSHERISMTLRRMFNNHNLRGIFVIAFVLYFFYSWMVIYTPLYLLQAGFDWTEIGLMFTVMLIPFVLVEYPAGYLADKYFGETEMLTIGLGIMAISLFVFITVSSFTGIMLALFCSRVGASLVEIMRESYFYKIVKAGDLDMMDTYRNMSPFAHVVGPALGTILLAIGVPFMMLFFILALMVAFTAAIPSSIRDTR